MASNVLKKAQAAIAACDKCLRDNEYNTRKLKGVSCSHSDVGTVKLYAETIAAYGDYSSLMRPHGAVEALLAKFGLL